MRSNTSDLIVKRINNISSIQEPTEKKKRGLNASVAEIQYGRPSTDWFFSLVHGNKTTYGIVEVETNGQKGYICMDSLSVNYTLLGMLCQDFLGLG